ncbi:MAG: 3-isopropylmalate/(R)-2-methylmalate dehydratase large subunit [Actinomycetota bacterium]|nr:3-isopropylmalate/(R)-2-methylmalate dehydratase large subunit [Actinomycetota bacterium]
MSDGVRPRSLLDRIWDAHRVAALAGGYDLLFVDRHLIHDLGGPGAFDLLRRRELGVRSPALTIAAADHCVSTQPGRTDATTRPGSILLPRLRSGCEDAGIRLFDIDSADQGIVHVVAPELGITLPGTTLLCGDSHTCTNGALGALAWGIGTSEVVHVLATQCIVEMRPRQCRVLLTGALSPGVHAKDVILALIAAHGTDGAAGHAVEFTGDAVDAMSIEARMTLCNLSIEFGAKFGLIAPDDKTVDYVAGRRFAPTGEVWDTAVAHWRTLRSDDDVAWDRTYTMDVGALSPQVSWGTSPGMTIPIDGRVPDGLDDGFFQARAYMGLDPGAPILGTPVDRVFIGSCANARLDDLVAAADVVRRAGRRVAPSVAAWVVPGSQQVKRDAEDLGLHEVFLAAGFEWREPGCSMCLATNEEYVAPGQRCVSTSNRNFVGRQGPDARTHLASPATAAATALAGSIADPRDVA